MDDQQRKEAAETFVRELRPKFNSSLEKRFRWPFDWPRIAVSIYGDVRVEAKVGEVDVTIDTIGVIYDAAFDDARNIQSLAEHLSIDEDEAKELLTDAALI